MSGEAELGINEGTVQEQIGRFEHMNRGSSSPQLSSRDRKEMPSHEESEIPKTIVQEKKDTFEHLSRGTSSPQPSSRDRRETPPHAGEAVGGLRSGSKSSRQRLQISCPSSDPERNRELGPKPSVVSLPFPRENTSGRRSSSDEVSSRSRKEMPSHAGKTEEANATQALESRLGKDLQQLSQQIQTLQQAFKNMQDSTQCDLQMIRADLENKRERTEEANTTRLLEPIWQKDLQQLSQQMQALQQTFQNRQQSTQCDLQLLRTDMDNKLGRTVQASKMAMESMECLWKKNMQEVFQKIQTLQEDFQNMLDSRKNDLELLRNYLEKERVLSKVQSYRGGVTLDADTAHPRLEISAGGRRMKDTGVIRDVPSNEKRFDSHLFVLAEEGYRSGKHYWEVYVGQRKNWALGIARESVTRKGTLTLSPQNGFWVIGLADGRDYWAYTDCWTRLSVSGQLQIIGIFLDILAKQVTFYDADKAAALYTFSIADSSSQEGKFIPFFSTGPATAEPDLDPLEIL